MDRATVLPAGRAATSPSGRLIEKPQDAPAPALPAPASEPWSARDVGLVFGLAAAALLLRSLAAWRTTVISRDGIYYVDLALMINTGQWLSCVGDWFLFNPYPPLIALVQRLGLDYDRAGQVVNLTAAGLGAIPLYAWCRAAFSRAIAAWATLIYAVHPVLIETSGQVYREGVYWLLLFSAVGSVWSASRRPALLRYAWCGVWVAGATLTRLEGAAVYVLLAAWSFHGQRRAAAVLRCAAAFSMLPLLLAALNLLLIPAGQPWRGFHRFTALAQRFVPLGLPHAAPPSQTAPEIAPPPAAGNELAGNPAAEPPRTVRALADGLPIWSPQGVPDLEQQRLRRFLILADDHRAAVYAGKFLSRAWEGLTFPLLAGLAVFLAGCPAPRAVSQKKPTEDERDLRWIPARDVGLAAYGGACGLALTYNLVAENVLESRYLFCLAPCVLPWAVIGLDRLALRLEQAYSRRSFPRAANAAILSVLILAALGKAFHGSEHDKRPQRTIGERIRQAEARRTRLAGPEPLKRIGHYAGGEYLIVPPHAAGPIDAWLRAQGVDYLVWPARDPLPGGSAQGLLPVWASEPDAGPIRVWRVAPVIPSSAAAPGRSN